MIEKFNKFKKELKEMADVLNAFKSEAVQLKIVELLFNYEFEDNQEEEKSVESTERKRRGATTKKSKTSSKNNSKHTRKTGGVSQSDILEKLTKEGFFDNPKTVGDIIKHCDTNFAKKFKSTDLSPYLTTRTRNGSLNRTKNPESKQYEYTKA